MHDTISDVSELAYVGTALLVTLFGSAVIWLKSRRPVSLESGVDEFSKGLQALQTQPATITPITARSRRG